MQYFTKGVNLGGWLSQYQKYNHSHFNSFIVQQDIEQIASWGFDHIRLPIDYPVLESDQAVGEYRETGFQYIDNCLDWCQSAELAVVLDLHHAPGYSFNNTLHTETQHLNSLFHNPELQARFINLWRAVVDRYKDARMPIYFELLNEVVLPETTPWNTLVQKTVNALRTIAPDCKLMIGSNNYNSAADLKHLTLFDDPNICYTFHFYEPLLFTHQKAPWSNAAKAYDQTLAYPGEFKGLEAFLARTPQYCDDYEWLIDKPLDRDLMYSFLQPALDFVRQTGKDLYCGEYGVIATVDPESRQNWHADLLAKLFEYHIGSAVWSYKEMDFGLVDSQGLVKDQELLSIICR